MKRILAIVVVAMLAGGCTTAYWQNRGHDAADIATLTVGMGGGAFVQVGPKPVGYGFIIDAVGVEDGKFGLVPYATALKGVAERFAVYDFDDIRVNRGNLPPLSVGVTPGELADFALGWFGVDIYGDDLANDSGDKKGAQDDRNCQGC